MGRVRRGIHGSVCCWRCDKCPKCDGVRILRGDYCEECTQKFRQDTRGTGTGRTINYPIAIS